MKRISIEPRKDYIQKIENLEFSFHPDYWLENAYYELSESEIEAIEKATIACYDMYCQAVERCLYDDELMKRLKIPEELWEWIRRSWEEDDLSLYGRFDFVFDGPNSKIPKLLEFNADTPTSLLEASIIQWDWKEDVFPHNDQWNNMHEYLVQSFKDIDKVYKCKEYVFASITDLPEDNITLSYILSCAHQAGLETVELDIRDIITGDSNTLYLPDGKTPINCCFKLYPWEDMFIENPSGCCTEMCWIEPLWKSLMSNKAMLPILWEMFPDSPYLLKAYPDKPKDMKDYVRKPVFSREGSNIKIVKDNKTLEETDGDYTYSGYIYQEYCELPEYSGNYPIIGSWVIGGESCGMGIRETNTRITDNLSRFVPHIIK